MGSTVAGAEPAASTRKGRYEYRSNVKTQTRTAVQMILLESIFSGAERALRSAPEFTSTRYCSPDSFAWAKNRQTKRQRMTTQRRRVLSSLATATPHCDMVKHRHPPMYPT
jgi:hypothetical protein